MCTCVCFPNPATPLTFFLSSKSKDNDEEDDKIEKRVHEFFFLFLFFFTIRNLDSWPDRAALPS